MKNITFIPISEAAVTAASSSRERLMLWSPSTSVLHVGGAGAVAWSSFVTAVCDMKVLNTSVKMSVMADAVVPHTWLCLCRLKTLFTLKLPASVYMMNPGVPAGAVRGKTLSALYRSDAVLGVHTGYFYEHFD